MKTLSLILIAFFIAIFSGCQENQINQPEISQINKDSLPVKNTIKICCEVRDPNYGICNLNGYVNYTHEVINRTMNPIGLWEISLKFHMSSKLCDKLGMVHLEWRIENRSEEIVYVSEEGILLLEKMYSITNRSDVVLLVRYLVTTIGVGLANVNLVRLERYFT